MKFQILSHAGLLVSNGSKTLVCDPWIVGSTYWRSWWNYPPVSPDLVATIKPDFVYLTHLHWDHFHGPSLRRFSRETPVVVPKGHFARLKRDLAQVGFHNVIELAHGQSLSLAPGFRITSYQFFPYLDSALMIDVDGVTLFNANDCKLMGGPLKQVLKRHPKIDFVFRSHSSANGRVCYEIVDDRSAVLDDESAYIKAFTAFAQTVGARYAIPFASNHCLLHKDVFHFNATVKTPYMVKKHFERENITSPQAVVMVSGDSWSPDGGFSLRPDGNRFYEDRDRMLAEYRDSHQEKLENFYRFEAGTTVTVADFERYFRPFFAALPFPVRFLYRAKPLRFVAHAGDKARTFDIDLYRRTVAEVTASPPAMIGMREIHVSAYVIRHAMAQRFCGQITISKRIKFLTTSADKKYLSLLVTLFNLYEAELLPLRLWLRSRSIGNWLRRWREVLLYARIAAGMLTGQRFSEERCIRSASQI